MMKTIDKVNFTLTFLDNHFIKNTTLMNLNTKLLDNNHLNNSSYYNFYVNYVILIVVTVTFVLTTIINCKHKTNNTQYSILKMMLMFMLIKTMFFCDN